MSRHVVIGTAGHVDHGKTALVRALTGIETDRLAEEKRRGITIELGFAHCRLGDLAASIVDVPGHEDFVRTMVAGATGVDVALLVIAADESVMPQTIEHVAILDFLGVAAGVVALTKADLVDAAWLDLVQADVRERLATSRVRWTAVVPVSSVTGAGLDALREALVVAAAGVAARRADDLFRLPVDRVFSVAGAGTVVTGTTWSGTVRVGEDVTVQPGGLRARVRGVQVHGEQRDAAEPGRRTALALTGLDRDAAGRGATVVAGAAWRATEALDVVLTLLPDAPALGQRTRVRVHLGTAEVLARVTPGADGVAPGATGPVRLRLEEPVVARWGDRVVIRSYSPVTTIGGAVVADPFPAPRPRRPGDLTALLGTEASRVTAAAERSGGHGLAVGDLPVRLGINPGGVAAIVASVAAAGIRRVGDRLMAEREVARAGEAVVDAVRRHHEAFPLEPGMPREAVRREGPDAEVVEAVLGDLVANGTLVVEATTVRLARHQAGLDGATAPLALGVRNALAGAGFEGKTLEELAALGPAAAVKAVVEFLARSGEATRVGRDRYLAPASVERLIADVRAALAELGEVGPAQLRDRLGLTRKFSIPLLEWLDGQGFTVRVGDARRAGPRLTGGSENP